MKRNPARCRNCKAVVKRGRCDCRQRVKAYLPPPEVIAAECAKIQATWPPDVEIQRRCRQNVSPDYGRAVRMESQGEDRPS